MDVADDRTVNRLGHMSALDGLRGIAIAAVVAKHYWNVPRGAGFGVDLFFVLSGFLITTLLLEERERTGRICLRAFFVRRGRRLLPALFAMLAAYTVVALATGSSHSGWILRSVGLQGFYTANVVTAYFPHLITHSALGPLWSLAEEEQFYLLWPAVLIVLLGRRLSPKWMTRVLLLAILAVIIERFVLTYGFHVWFKRISFSPESHCDGLLAGSLLAFMLRRKRAFAAEFAVIALLLLAWLAFRDPPLAIAGPIIDFAGAALIACVVLNPSSVLTRGLSWRPLAGLGLISYSLYLWHTPVNYALDSRHQVVALVGSLAIAYASYRWVEQPFRRRRRESARSPEHRQELPAASLSL